MDYADTPNLPQSVLPPLSGGACAALINDGQRLHLHHGPIDLIVDIGTDETLRHKAFVAGARAFDGLLESLVSDLKTLKKLNPDSAHVSSACASSMIKATAELPHYGLTPMAAVAGAVADHILNAIKRVAGDTRILVNNGGDIAVHLGSSQTCSIGIVPNPEAPAGLATIALNCDSGVGGVASSGWRGRSHSLGIADSVTVLACNAASADSMATAIANAVAIDGEHVGIQRQIASELDDDTDLGQQRVTVRVDPLPQLVIQAALANGAAVAKTLYAEKKLISVCLHLQGVSSIVGNKDMWFGEQSDKACLLHHEQNWRI